jgi:uncharacterized membrane protein
MLDQLYAFLASTGFAEPLHSPITHMPIGLAAGAMIFFLVAIVFKKKQLVLTARHASILAFIFVFPTILLGVMDWIHFYNATLFTPIKIKMALASAALVILGAGIILGSEVKLHTMKMTMLYVVGFGVMVGLGYFGAGIIYGRGLEMKSPKTATAEISTSPADSVQPPSASTDTTASPAHDSTVAKTSLPAHTK